jgi:hypothetical protein
MVFASIRYGSFTNGGDKGSGDPAGSLVSSKESVDNEWLQLERKYVSTLGL